ncbi:MAG: lipoate--protein ligase family protein [Candidatus Omnitrophica bacterium]|nr:lipoate--protein ligase family protein [Candidatus Omnitrophota bacterium]
MREFRLIRSYQTPDVNNMAFDEFIFKRYLQDRVPVFRVYRWKSPSFTYGISQDPAVLIDIDKCALNKVEIAKRMTGGGLLFHDDEITYSFVCSKLDVGEPENVFVSYREICSFLISFYESLGLKASFAINSPDFRKHNTPHELCSASREKFDIIINGKKIGGNAQKRKRDVVFQHGSVPRSIDWDLQNRFIKFPPEDNSSYVTTLSQELVAVPNNDVLEEKLIEAFSRSFGVDFIEESKSRPGLNIGIESQDRVLDGCPRL